MIGEKKLTGSSQQGDSLEEGLREAITSVFCNGELENLNKFRERDIEPKYELDFFYRIKKETTLNNLIDELNKLNKTRFLFSLESL